MKAFPVSRRGAGKRRSKNWPVTPSWGFGGAEFEPTGVRETRGGDGSTSGSGRIDSGMTTKEYARQYSDALAKLRSRACKVASPYATPDGIRRVQINNHSCIDQMMFERAWGQQVAEKIMRKTPSSR